MDNVQAVFSDLAPAVKYQRKPVAAPIDAVAPSAPPAIAVRNVFELAADYGIQFD